MLRRILIRNYALIEEVELELDGGLTVITGETGSGKSIMLGALSLVLGNRADSRVAGEGKSHIEAEFEDVDPSLKSVFEAHGIDWIENEPGHAEATIRREISGKGRARIFVNDSSVTLNTLSEIGPRLLDIHSQHANARLSDTAEQLRVVDVFAGVAPSLEEYQRTFRRLASLKRKIDAVKKRIEDSRRNEMMIRYKLGELEELKPKSGELSEIEKRYEMLSDADEIKERISTLSAMMGDGDNGLLQRMEEVRGLMGRIDFSLFGENGSSADLMGRMEGMYTELRDMADTVEDMNAAVDTDPRTLAQLSERMRKYYDALKRFNVKDGDELVSVYDGLKRQLAEIDGGGDELPALEREAREVAVEVRKRAERLTTARRSAAVRMAKSVLEATKNLGLPNLRFEIRVEDTKISSMGKDKVEFYCSFNKNGEMRPVGETASGGEMSRLMLALKSVVAAKMEMPTVVFDEVDTGVSGEIAERMGLMLRRMGQGMQVMAITHLPQVASQGHSHFKVYKEDVGNKTHTQVRKLKDEERIREIAAMMSGSEVTAAALQAAGELMRGQRTLDL